MRFLVVSAYWVETDQAGGLELDAKPIKGSGAMVSITEDEALSRGVGQLAHDLRVFQLDEAANWIEAEAVPS